MGKEKVIIGANSGANYIIEKEIGSGGQGKVFSIQGGKYAFKLIGLKTSSKSILLKRKISYLKTRPLDNLPISIPIEQVEGKALGYIMEMATDMFPLDTLITPDNTKDFTTWWKETGGLKKRILILKNISKTLSELHSRGFVYGDLSLSNIFVSNDKDYAEIFFIDADNITHDSKVGTAVYTPGYAAPEIVQTENHKALSGYDTYTDNFSFAILAYQLLTLNHPFIGDYVNEGEPELEEEAYLGKIPWVNHSTEDLNKTSRGIPNSLTISKKMMNAFKFSFEQGITQKTKRTSALKWCEILTSASGAIIKCENESCKQYLFYPKNMICPFCENKLDYIGIASLHSITKPIKDDVKNAYSVELEDEQNIGKAISKKLFNSNEYVIFHENDFLLNKSNKKLFKLKLIEDSLYIEGIELNQISIISNKKLKEAVKIIPEIKVKLNGVNLFIDDLNKYQRILKIKKHSI